MAFDADSIRDDNICVIWVDDMIDVFTWRDTFGLTIQTPNLDRLMAGGSAFPMPMRRSRSAPPAGPNWPPACRRSAPGWST
jgi:hypothetical protein